MTPGQRQYQELMAQASTPGPGNNHCARRLVVIDRLFTPDECKRAVRSFDRYPREPGLVGKPAVAENPDTAYSDEQDKTLRDCLVTYTPRTKHNHWLHERLELAMLAANAKYWRCDITDFSQPMRLMTYRNGHHFNSLHQDFGPGDTCYRKLTAVLQVSSPEDYDGGEFEVVGDTTPATAWNQGSVLIFPAYLVHRAGVVTRGQRQTIIHRAIGPYFR